MSRGSSWVALAVAGLSLGSGSSIRAEDASAALMADAAKNFLINLDGEQREQAVFAFDAQERDDWHFIPKQDRKGLPLKAMRSDQMHLVHLLLSTSLSRTGYGKVLTIMSLEEVLRDLESKSDPPGRFLHLRNPLLYYMTVFGEPSDEGTWGWSLEGHHVSLNFTFVDGQVSSTPTFLGANPHQVLAGPRKGLRALAHEEDQARDLLLLLDGDQKARAILQEKPPADIFTSAKREVEFEAPARGLAAKGMSADQKKALRALIEGYIQNMPEDLAAKRRAQLEGADFDSLHFAWIGGVEKGPGTPHYYRVQAPTFLIEYDNVQNGANHSHTVWRDYNGDFGRDLLREHHTRSH